MIDLNLMKTQQCVVLFWHWWCSVRMWCCTVSVRNMVNGYWLQWGTWWMITGFSEEHGEWLLASVRNMVNGYWLQWGAWWMVTGFSEEHGEWLLASVRNMVNGYWLQWGTWWMVTGFSEEHGEWLLTSLKSEMWLHCNLQTLISKCMTLKNTLSLKYPFIAPTPPQSPQRGNRRLKCRWKWQKFHDSLMSAGDVHNKVGWLSAEISFLW